MSPYVPDDALASWFPGWDALPISLFAVAAESGAILFANSRAQQSIGAATDLVGQPINNVLPVTVAQLSAADRVTVTVLNTDHEPTIWDCHARLLKVSSREVLVICCTEPNDFAAARLDHLTELPTRAVFDLYLERAFLRRERQSDYDFAVLFVDIDRLKPVNDELGHNYGDQLLRYAAQRIRKCIRGQDLAARRGGDEFTILISNLPNRKTARVVAERILQAFEPPFVLGSETIDVGASVGIAFPGDEHATAEALLHAADQAMYRVKRAGGVGYAIGS